MDTLSKHAFCSVVFLQPINVYPKVNPKKDYAGTADCSGLFTRLSAIILVRFPVIPEKSSHSNVNAIIS